MITVSKYDAAINSGLGKDFPACDIFDPCVVAHGEFMECLGSEFEAVLDPLQVDYTGVTKWVAGTYNLGDNVIYGQRIRQATKTTTATPDNDTDWRNAPKFDDSTDCGKLYNEMWCKYLLPYIAFKVQEITMGLIASQTRPVGEVTMSGDGYSPTSRAQIEFKYAALKKVQIMYFQQAIEYAKKYPDCFKYFKAAFPENYCKNCCEPICEKACSCSGGDCLTSRKKILKWEVY